MPGTPRPLLGCSAHEAKPPSVPAVAGVPSTPRQASQLAPTLAGWPPHTAMMPRMMASATGGGGRSAHASETQYANILRMAHDTQVRQARTAECCHRARTSQQSTHTSGIHHRRARRSMCSRKTNLESSSTSSDHSAVASSAISREGIEPQHLQAKSAHEAVQAGWSTHMGHRSHTLAGDQRHSVGVGDRVVISRAEFRLHAE